MKRRTFLRLSAMAPLAFGASRVMADTSLSAARIHATPNGKPHTFGFHGREFLLDGQPMQIRAGQMDPIRVPRSYWVHRIRMAKAMGLNTISLYLMWNALEPEPGKFDLTTDRNDFSHFIELCAQEGMWVFLRPGPYVCAEWDFGGLPAWLLRDPSVRVRQLENAHYMQAVSRYFDALAPVIQPLLVQNGGPVLMVQLANEYNDFSRGPAYIPRLRRMWEQRGVDIPFAIADGMTPLDNPAAAAAGTAVGLDGPLGAKFRFDQARSIAGQAPVFVAEAWVGWYTRWNDEAFATVAYADKLRELATGLRQLMDADRSFSLYEVHGGTNFGFGAGANAKDDGSDFSPMITSYNYGAPINERGEPTANYHAFRSIITGTLKQPVMDMPPVPPVGTFASVKVKPYASLWDNLPAPIHVHRPQSNEVLFGRGSGMVVYRKRIQTEAPTMLRIEGVRDYATVFVDGQYAGLVSRVKDQDVPEGNTLKLPSTQGRNVELEILVDSFGHVNYGHFMRDEKGLVGHVYLDKKPLHGWQVHGLPLDNDYVRTLKPAAAQSTRPGMFFRAKVERDDATDCYVDLSEWNKGYVWVNGHLLGRYWHIGPQQRFYCPAEWWKQGRNEVVIFDQHMTRGARIRGVTTLIG